uniref:Uncharacterized protein n=1 Tax=Oryza alta TaxID=52545 RepID=A0A1V1H102_9ORYZ|nr:hypothetical protein [Oryza alta]
MEMVIGVWFFYLETTTKSLGNAKSNGPGSQDFKFAMDERRGGHRVNCEVPISMTTDASAPQTRGRESVGKEEEQQQDSPFFPAAILLERRE